jgi:hypothetical protein
MKGIQNLNPKHGQADVALNPSPLTVVAANKRMRQVATQVMSVERFFIRTP